MNTLVTPAAGIVGTDNIAPIYNPNGRYQVWSIAEIFFGKEGAGKYVPKVNDLVSEVADNSMTWYAVASINQATLVPTLREISMQLQTPPLSQTDILLGANYWSDPSTYRVYVDTSVYPYRVDVDSRLKVYGSMCHHAKLFKGPYIDKDSVVVSETYDQNGQLTSENVLLEKVLYKDHITSEVRVIGACHTTQSLDDGELITAVIYDVAGVVVSKRQLLVENTGFIRSADADRRYVTGISLETPFLSTSATKTINYPLNVPLSGINMLGVVHYSDGSKVRLQVDGNRFSVAGLDSFVPTIVGLRNQLVLKYVFQDGEYAYGVSTTNDNHISEVYDIVTVNSEGTYAVQLYGYPVWVDQVSGYRLEWYMYDLDRSVSYNVSQWVAINTNKSVYKPTGYGTKQSLSVSLDLSKVDGRYKKFTHVQLVEITLKRSGDNRPFGEDIGNWTTCVTDGKPVAFGALSYATFYREATNKWLVNVDANIASQGDWLDHVYKRTYPMYDNQVESQAPQPTHFRLIAGGNIVTYALSEWNSQLVLSQSLTNGSMVYLKFIKRTADVDLQLSIAGLQLFQVDQSGNFV